MGRTRDIKTIAYLKRKEVRNKSVNKIYYCSCEKEKSINEDLQIIIGVICGFITMSFLFN